MAAKNLTGGTTAKYGLNHMVHQLTVEVYRLSIKCPTGAINLTAAHINQINWTYFSLNGFTEAICLQFDYMDCNCEWNCSELIYVEWN
jgi:hypothetical protein